MWQLSKAATSASTACASSARAPLRKTSVSGSPKLPGRASGKTLVSVTAYHSFWRSGGVKHPHDTPPYPFYFAALAQLEPARRPVFTEHVTRLLGAHPNPAPGDVDRAVRQGACGRRRQSRNSRDPRAGIAIRRSSSGSPRARCRAAHRAESCGALVDSVWTHGGW